MGVWEVHPLHLFAESVALTVAASDQSYCGGQGYQNKYFLHDFKGYFCLTMHLTIRFPLAVTTA
jgi:hypothetical protein